MKNERIVVAVSKHVAGKAVGGAETGDGSRQHGDAGGIGVCAHELLNLHADRIGIICTLIPMLELNDECRNVAAAVIAGRIEAHHGDHALDAVKTADFFQKIQSHSLRSGESGALRKLHRHSNETLVLI